ncbi:RDD family protein [Polynucleobacter meluiroseus]|uniref:RDD family protein n=1 Tax=Polynucleobacter meluiroseus TaxID=1938814 RepID=A0A240DZI9_9BURK|nr:RDD family protein [Polynucleobacter meluiroseus]SNX28423.1 RDD family protein [Polynucleobacter meluiroseus]
MTPAEFNALPAPLFWRRVACALYEQLVLLGVIALCFLLPNLALGMLFGLALPSWLSFCYLYAVLGIYFVWYWTKSGQTLAMQTWNLRIIGPGGFNLTRRLALRRYLLGSLWILPCIGLQAILHLKEWQIIEMLFVTSLFFWPLSIFIDPKPTGLRQDVPDRIAGTRIVQIPKSLVTLS